MKILKAIELDTGQTDYTNTDIGLCADGKFRFVTGRGNYNDGVNIWYADLLTDIGKSKRKVDIETTGSYGTLSDFDFSIENSQAVWALLEENGVYISGKSVKYYYVIDDTFYVFWTGTVRDDPRGETEYKIKCVDGFQKKHKSKKFPPRIGTDSEFPNIPDEYNGEVVPVSIGDVPYNKAYITSLQSESLTPPLVATAKSLVGGRIKIDFEVYPFNLDTINNNIDDSNIDYLQNIDTLYYLRVVNADVNVLFPLSVQVKNTSEITVLCNGFIEDIGSHLYNGDVTDKDLWVWELVKGSKSALLTNNGSTNPMPLKKYDDGEEIDISGVVTGRDSDFFYLNIRQQQKEDEIISYGNAGAIKGGLGGAITEWYYLSQYNVETDTDYDYLYAKTTGTDDEEIIDMLDEVPDKKGYSLTDLDNTTYIRIPSAKEATTPQGDTYYKTLWRRDYAYGDRYKNYLSNLTLNYDVSNVDLDEDVYVLPRFAFTQYNALDEALNLDVFILRMEFEPFKGSGTFGANPIKNESINLKPLYNNGIRLFNFIPKSVMEPYSTSTSLWGYNGEMNAFKIPDVIKDTLKYTSDKTLRIKIFLQVEQDITYYWRDTHFIIYQLLLVNKFKIPVDNGKIYTKNYTGETYSGEETDNVYNAYRLLMETYGGELPANIDYSNLPTTRQDWHCGRQINEQENLLKILGSLAQESFTAIIPLRNGKRRVKAWREDTSTPITHNESDVIDGSIKSVEVTPVYDLYNNFTIKYQYNQFSDKFERSYSVNNISEDAFPNVSGGWQSYFTGLNSYPDAKELWEACHKSYKQVGYEVSPKEDLTELKWVIDPATVGKTEYQGVDSSAYKYLRNLIEYTAYRKLKIKYQIPVDTNNISLELLDKIEFADTIFTNGDKKVGYIYSIENKGDNMEIGVLFEPEEVYKFNDIIETGSNDDDIIETGSNSDNVIEG